MNIDYNDLEEQIKMRGKVVTLGNGLTLITENVPGSQLASGRVSINVGSSYEDSNDKGVMHLLEHMSFGSSRRFSNRDQRNMEASLLGMDIKANTGPFCVRYPILGHSGYLLQDNFLEALKIVLDIAFFPCLTEEDKIREVPVVLREIDESQQTQNEAPLNSVARMIKKKIYENNLCVFDETLGTESSVRGLTLDLLKKYHSRFFVGKNALVEVVGNLENGLESTIHSILEEIPSGECAKLIEFVPESKFCGREFMRLPYSLNGNKIVQIFFQTDTMDLLNIQNLGFLSYILGVAPMGLLFRDLREKKGLVYSVSCDSEGHNKVGYLKIDYTVAEEKLDSSLSVIDENLRNLKLGNFDERLIDAYKANFLPKVLASLQKPGWIYEELIDRFGMERFGYQSTPLQRMKLIFEMEKRKVVEAANRIFGEDRLIVVVG